MPIRTHDPTRARSRKSSASKGSGGFGDPVPLLGTAPLQPAGQISIPPPTSYQTMGTAFSPSNIISPPAPTFRGSTLRTHSQKMLDRHYQHHPYVRVSDAQYQITMKDKMRYHAITMMKVCNRSGFFYFVSVCNFF